jgi:hypothetical protein
MGLSLHSEFRCLELEEGKDFDLWLRKGGFQPGCFSVSIEKGITTERF